MACCWSRDGANHHQRASEGSPFDAEILAGFKAVLDAGIMRSTPSQYQRRKLEGPLGLHVQFSRDHFGKKRKPKNVGEEVVVAVDPEAWNFTKADPSERIAEVEALPQGGGRTAVLANVSPLCFGHVLFVPGLEQVHPQMLTEEHFLVGLHLATRSARRDFRLLYNSPLGFASVNHFHWHGMYLDYFGLPDGQFPIERAARSLVAGGNTEGRTAAELLVEAQWYVRGFVLTAGCKPGSEGPRPPADLAALASLAGRVVRALVAGNVPHNVVIAPPSLGERRPLQAHNGVPQAEDAGAVALSPEVFIIPRRPESEMREGAGFNGAVCEMAGMLTVHTEDMFASITESFVQEVFRKDVSLPDGDFDELLCKVAWMPS